MTAFLVKYRAWVVGILITLVVAGVGGSCLERNRNAALSSAEAGLHVAQDSLRAVVKAVAVRDGVVVELTARADTAALRAASAERAAHAAQAQVPQLRARVDSVVKDSAGRAAVAALTGALERRADSLDVALVLRGGEIVQLRSALDSAEKSVHLLVPVAMKVDTAATVVVAKIRPSLFARITPKPGYGLAAGIDQNGHPAILVGVTLSWPR